MNASATVTPIKNALRLLGAMLPLLVCASAFADGGYFPERVVQKLPTIPSQRALILWKDGVEDLVISSALDSEAQKLGWIIPLPAIPTTMEKADPGTLKTLAVCLQPDIVHDLFSSTMMAAWIFIIATLLLIGFLFQRQRFVEWGVGVIILLLFGGLLLPNLGGVRGGHTGILGQQIVVTTKIVGHYEIAVLKPATAEQLSAWLETNEYVALPPQAIPVVADYIGQKWVFAAIKLARADKGLNAPHPIRFSFPTAEAIYPFKLTVALGNNPLLELYVIADERAQSDPLAVEFCDRFTHGMTEYTGKHTQTLFEQPTLFQWLWPHCVITKLSGTVNPADRPDDLRIQWAPFQPFQQRLFTHLGAYYIALIAAMVLMGLFLIISMAALRHRISQLGSTALRWYARRMLAPGIGAIAMVCGVLYLALPKLKTDQVQVASRIHEVWHHSDLRNRIVQLFLDHPQMQAEGRETIAEWLTTQLRPFHNIITGGPLLCENSPGNFTVEREGRKFGVRWHDRTGRPVMLFELPVVSQEPLP